MGSDLLINGVSAVNAVAIVVSVWLLSDGRLRRGNAVMLVASFTGMFLGVVAARRC